MLFCRRHWFALPKKIQDAIWREYRDGQEIDKQPSVRYLAVQRLACAYSVFKPDDGETILMALKLFAAAKSFAEICVARDLGNPFDGLIIEDQLPWGR